MNFKLLYFFPFSGYEKSHDGVYISEIKPRGSAQSEIVDMKYTHCLGMSYYVPMHTGPEMSVSSIGDDATRTRVNVRETKRLITNTYRSIN